MTATQAPEGFREVHAEEATGTRLEKEVLRQGVVVQFRGTRRFARSNDNGTTVVHVFLARGGKGERFSTFGTAQLDSKLRGVKPGSILWLSYGGKKLIDGQEAHDWNVSDAGLRCTDEKIAALSSNSAKEHDALDEAISRAAAENATRVSRGGGSSDFDPTDFDFPNRR